MNGKLIKALGVAGVVALTGCTPTSGQGQTTQATTTVGYKSYAPDRVEAQRNITEWQLAVVKKLTPVEADDFGMAPGTYRDSKPKQDVYCRALVKDTAKAMNETRPAPDDTVQRHFAAMLYAYKKAGDQCVNGQMGESYSSLRKAETERDAMNARIKELNK